MWGNAVFVMGSALGGWMLHLGWEAALGMLHLGWEAGLGMLYLG